MNVKIVRRGIPASIAVAALALGALAPQPGAAAQTAVADRAAGPTADESSAVRFTGTPQARPIPRPAGLSPESPPAAIAKAVVGSGRGKVALADNEELRVASVHKGARGGDIVRFQRYVGDVPLLGAEVVVDLDAHGDARAISSETTAEKSVKPGRAEVTAAQARNAAIVATAKAHPEARGGMIASRPERWLYDPAILGAPGLPGTRLMWRTEVTSPNSADVRQLVLVDAATGSVALSIDQVDNAKERHVCDAALSQTKVPCLPANYVRNEGDPASGIVDVNNAYAFAGDTYDFFSTRLGRDSLDGAGMPLVSTVRFCNPSCPYRNAFWNGEQMVYGQDMASDDVVGHELTHGVTEFTSGLFYYYQSGAINESLSDIFGEFVDQTNGVGNDAPGVKWQLGEDLPVDIGVIRNMANPPAFNDPDRMGSPNYFVPANAIVSGADGGGVHTNSGVGNKFAYLITDGDSFNGQTVTGLGIDKAARIIYGGAGLLTSGSDYQGFAKALRQSCTTLVGSAGITAADCIEVDDALKAVEMDVTPAAAPLSQAPVCAPGQKAIDVFADDMENPASGKWTRAAAVGSLRWYYASETNPVDFDPRYGTSGSNNLWGYPIGSASDQTMAMANPVRVPSGDAHLRFNHAYDFELSSGVTYDGGVLEYNVGGGWLDAAPLVTEGGYNGTISNEASNPLKLRSGFVSESKGYTSTRLNLASLAGQDVAFRFRIGTDSTGDDYGWFIDDVRIYTCASAPAAPVLNSLTPGIGTLQVASTLAADGGAPISAVEYRLDGGSWVSTGQASGAFAIAGLTGGRTYSVAVRAVNAVGPGVESNTVTGTPLSPPPPPPVVTPPVVTPPVVTPPIQTPPVTNPSTPKPTVDPAVSRKPGKVARLRVRVKGSKAVVTWRRPSDDGGSAKLTYRVRLSKPGGKKFGRARTVNTTTIRLKGLKRGSRYVVKVVAANPGGTGGAVVKSFIVRR